MSNTSESNIAGLRVENLRCEFLIDPIGVDVAAPRLSWELTSDRTGAHQVAYRIAAGDWDTGRIQSCDTAHIAYGGPPLRSGQRVTWRVEVEDDEASLTRSPDAGWEMG
ncbi:MAG: alpha-L-rhamnosidase, partial [Actinobacteria bacterium]|nr:alpha-L-rhamnosidase [Actinomycetota bacterium]